MLYSKIFKVFVYINDFKKLRVRKMFATLYSVVIAINTDFDNF